MAVASDTEYVGWMLEHLEVFGIRGTPFEERFRGSMMSWQREFYRRDYSKRELAQATQDMIGADVPYRYAEDHRAAIVKSIAIQRDTVRKAAANKATIEGRYTHDCLECGGCGIIVVPMLEKPADGAAYAIHRKWEPHHVLAGREVYYTAAITCDFTERCLRQRGDGMRLSRFNKIFPNWKTEMLRVEEIIRAEWVNDVQEEVSAETMDASLSVASVLRRVMGAKGQT